MNAQFTNGLGQIAFVPNHHLIVGTGGSASRGNLGFWSSLDGKLREVVDLGDRKWATSLAVSSDGALVAVAMLPHTLGCYSVDDRRWLWRLDSSEAATVGNSMQFSLDSQRLLVVSFSVIVTYDARSGAMMHNWRDKRGFSAGFPRYRTRFTAISPNGQRAAFWQGGLEHDEGWWHSKNVWVAVWDLGTGKTISKQARVQDKYKNSSAVFTPDSRGLLLGSMNGIVRVWSIVEQRVVDEWQVHDVTNLGSFRKDPSPYPIQTMAFSSTGQSVAVMARGGIGIWSWPAHKLVHEFRDVVSSGSLSIGSGYAMAFSADGATFGLESRGRLCLYDTRTWNEDWCVTPCD